MPTKNNNRTEKLAADQSMCDGIDKHRDKLPASFPMEGQQQTLDGVTQVFQGRIATGKAVVTADNARKAAVKADRDERAKTRGTALAFKRLLIALFAQDPAVLGDFAVTAPKPRQQTTAQKAASAAKGTATRKAHKKTAVQAVVESPTAAPAATAAPQPAQHAPAPVAEPAPKPVS